MQGGSMVWENKRLKILRAISVAGVLGWTCVGARAQEAPVSRDEGGPARTLEAQQEPEQSRLTQDLTHPADGTRRNGLPAEAYAVVPGTRVLVRLEDELDTGETKTGKRFHAKTLEPMEAGSGIYLPAGAVIEGHVSRVDPAGVAGRAKMWLVFDEIRTKFGPLPIVADVVGVPGDHSIRSSGPEKEGVIESRTSTQQAAGEAAAEGAGKGAIRGIKDKNAKEAAELAAVAALEAYLMEAGRGHELSLPKGAKLELELERALYLLKE